MKGIVEVGIVEGGCGCKREVGLECFGGCQGVTSYDRVGVNRGAPVGPEPVEFMV